MIPTAVGYWCGCQQHSIATPTTQAAEARPEPAPLPEGKNPATTEAGRESDAGRIEELVALAMRAVLDPGQFAPGYGTDYTDTGTWQRTALRIAFTAALTPATPLERQDEVGGPWTGDAAGQVFCNGRLTWQAALSTSPDIRKIAAENLARVLNEYGRTRHDDR